MTNGEGLWNAVDAGFDVAMARIRSCSWLRGLGGFPYWELLRSEVKEEAVSADT